MTCFFCEEYELKNYRPFLILWSYFAMNDCDNIQLFFARTIHFCNPVHEYISIKTIMSYKSIKSHGIDSQRFPLMDVNCTICVMIIFLISSATR